MTRAQMLAHRWFIAVASAALLAVVSWGSRTAMVNLPVLAELVPARLLVSVAAVVVALTPLYSTFPELERSLVREPRTRVVRVAVAVALAFVAVLPGWLSATVVPEWPIRTDVALFLLLVACGLLALVVLGDLAWIVALSLGLLSIFADLTPQRPVTTFLAHTPISIPLVLLLLSAAALIWRGPRMAH